MVLSKSLPMKMEMLMSPQGKFAVFCAEQYKLRKNLTGRQLTSLFQRYDVWDYLFPATKRCIRPEQIISSRTLSSIFRNGKPNR